MIYRSITLLSGAVNSGKSTCIESFIHWGRDNDYLLDGIYTPSFFNEHGKKQYQLVQISSGVRIPLTSEKPDRGTLTIGQFHFLKSSVQKGMDYLFSLPLHENKLIIIDELGPAELQGLVWCKPFEKILHLSSCPLLVAVRSSILHQVEEKWQLKNTQTVMLDLHPLEKLKRMMMDIQEPGR